MNFEAAFGFTNENKTEAAKAYRQAAVSDGWTIEPLYQNESVDSAAKLTKDGFIMHILSRINEKNAIYKYQIDITIWDDRKIQIIPPDEYNWQEIQNNCKQCHECRKTNVETFRVGFAGRSCADCLPAARKKYEFPGWTS